MRRNALWEDPHSSSDTQQSHFVTHLIVILKFRDCFEFKY